jgi:hypothetical protein
MLGDDSGPNEGDWQRLGSYTVPLIDAAEFDLALVSVVSG